MLNNVER